MKDLFGFIGRKFFTFLYDLTSIASLFWETLVQTVIVASDRKKRKQARVLSSVGEIGSFSIPLVMLVSSLLGIALTVVIASNLEDLGMLNAIPGVLVVTVYRFLGPLLTGIIVAGRMGAAITARIGTMKVTDEVLALEVMAISPVRFLVVRRFLGMIIALPALTVLGSFTAVFASFLFGDDVSGGPVGVNPHQIETAVLRLHRHFPVGQRVDDTPSVLGKRFVLEVGGNVREGTSHVGCDQVDHPGRLGIEALDPEIGIQENDSRVDAVEDVLHVVFGMGELVDLGLELRVFRDQLLVDALQFLLRGLQFLVGALEFLVGALELLVRRFQLLVLGLELLDARLEILPRVVKLLFQFRDPRILGVERRKENRADASRSIPLKSPAAIVMPERETPGMMAIACAMPITRASPKVTASTFLYLYAFSAQSIMKPMPIKIKLMSKRFLIDASIKSFSRYPAIPAGTDAMQISTNNLCFRMISSTQSFQKQQSRDQKVPAWRAISKVRVSTWPPQLKNQGSTIRWAVLLTEELG